MEATSSLKSLVIGDLDDELAATRRLLERIPEKHLGWRPHERSMSLGGLAIHLANLPFWQHGLLRDDGFDLAALPPPLAEPASRDEVLQRFDANVAALSEATAQADDAALGRTWTLRHGERVITTLPKAIALRRIGISHMIHHRGQLTVYLRLLDVPLPPLYGPTADESGAF
jgi:uncharacterized damage-inducible protein DinB